MVEQLEKKEKEKEKESKHTVKRVWLSGLLSVALGPVIAKWGLH